MFIKNPNPKVTYSFRIKEKLLERLKAYAKATDQSLPETLNYLLEESIDGINTGNTYLTDYDGTQINIPLGYPITVPDYNDIDYLNFEEDGLTYKVEQIPNNLDNWSSKGYYSKDYPDILHEGVSLLIVPELIIKSPLKLTTQVIRSCVRFIYFEIGQNTLQVKSISRKDCFRRLREAGNEEILKKFKSIDSRIYKFSVSYMAEFEKDPEPNIDKHLANLYGSLVRYAKTYNDNNITNLEDIDTFGLPPAPDGDDTETKPKRFEIYPKTDNILTEILEENRALQNKVQDLEDDFNKLNELVKKLPKDL